MRRLRLVLLAAAPSTVALTAAAAAGAGAAPTLIHTSADLGAVLHRPIVVASGEPACQDAIGELGLVQAVQAQGEALRLLLLSPDSSPELRAKVNLTSCTDLAFIDPDAAAVGVGIDAQGGVVELAETPTATGTAATTAEATEAAEAGKPIHFAPTSSQELQHFLQEMTGGFNVAFANDFPFAVTIHWVNPSTGAEVFNGRLAANQTTQFVSFRGHRFVIRGEKMGTLLGACEVAQGDQTFFAKRVAAASVAASNGEVEACSYPEEGFEEDKAEAARVIETREACHARRLGHNRDMPGYVHHFNEVPFKKTRVPAALWAEIQRFFAENRHREIQEGWPYGDCYTNAYEVPTTIVTLTDSMRSHIFAGVKPVLEEWIGGDIPLHPTSAYGIRLYHRGAKLYKHCDRVSTHAVSAIINVAQFGLEEPWPLQIHDHQGREHTVLMEPGDMVLYESASAVHGREIPLNGTAMANCFIHYKPEDWNYSYAF